jgi:hypothetical protein
MSGCSSTQTLIKHSDVAIMTDDGKKMYISNSNQGPLIYRTWNSGCYGDSVKVHLVDTVTFGKLCKKSIPCTCNRDNPLTFK